MKEGSEMGQVGEILGCILVIAGLVCTFIGIVLSVKTPHSLEEIATTVKGWVDGWMLIAVGVPMFVAGAGILRGGRK
jgi:hypothetical protein